MTWQVRSRSAPTTTSSPSRSCQKQNDGARVGHVGLEFDFAPDRIKVRNVNVATVDGLAANLLLRVRIEHALKRGPMTLKALADELARNRTASTKPPVADTKPSGVSPEDAFSVSHWLQRGSRDRTTVRIVRHCPTTFRTDNNPFRGCLSSWIVCPSGESRRGGGMNGTRDFR
jgi:hypothetical protein